MTIYDDIGGHDAVAAVVDAFYERVLADPHLAPWFDGIDTRRLKSHQRSFIAAAIGGPAAYAGRPMAGAHAGLAITADAFARVVDHLTTTLTTFAVTADTIATITATLAPLEPEIVARHPTSAT